MKIKLSEWTKRTCYIDPENPDRCIKELKLGKTKIAEFKRRIDSIIKIWSNINKT